MKTLCIAFLLLISLPVMAEPADDMHAECVRQMALGSCAALAPMDSYTDLQLAQPVLLIGIGRVTLRDFLAVRGIGSVSPEDTRMCDVAAAACRGDWSSARCMVGRSLWGR